MASTTEHSLTLNRITEKLKHINDTFECFKEDFANFIHVGNDIKFKLRECCLDVLKPFENVLDKFLDTLIIFDKGLKTNLEIWLNMQSTIAGKCRNRMISTSYLVK